jgi:hypothetical protein
LFADCSTRELRGADDLRDSGQVSVMSQQDGSMPVTDRGDRRRTFMFYSGI